MKCVICGYDDNGTGDSAHMCSTKPYLPRDCKHGQLARSCEICGLEAENTALQKQLEQEHAARLNVAAMRQEFAIENAALKAELAARWLPIDSAPKDTKIFLWGKYWSDEQGVFQHPMIGMWNPHSERWECNFNGWFGVRPTHWKPLLAAPGAKQGWKLVPLEPTEEMLQADVETDAFIGIDDARKLYSAMIAAAPGAKP